MTFAGFDSIGVDLNSPEIVNAQPGSDLIPDGAVCQFMLNDISYHEEENPSDPAKKGCWIETELIIVGDKYKNRRIWSRYQIKYNSGNKDGKGGTYSAGTIKKLEFLAQALGYHGLMNNPLEMKGNQTIFEAKVIVSKGGKKKDGTLYKDKNDIDKPKALGGGMIPTSQPQMAPAQVQQVQQPQMQAAPQQAPVMQAPQMAPATQQMQSAPAFLQNQ